MPIPQEQPEQPVVSRKGLHSLSVIALILGGILLIISITQMFRPLNAPDYADAKCGTVFTSDDDWTYRDSYSPDIDLDDYIARGRGAVTDKFDELMDHLNVGSAAFDKCRGLHNDQWIIIGFTGVPGLLLLLGGGLVFFRTRPRARSVEPAVETWGSPHSADTAR